MAIKLFDQSAAVSYKVNDAIEKTGIDHATAGLALSLAFGGPIGLAKDLIVDTVVGDQIAQAGDALKNEVTAVVRDTSYDTVSGYTSDGTKQQLSNLNDPASQTALQVSEQLQRTKDGVGFLAGVLGVGGVAKTIRVDGQDVEVDIAGIGNGGNQHYNSSKKEIFVDTSKSLKGSYEYDVLNNPPANSHVKLDNGNEFKTNAHGYVEELSFQPTLNKMPRDSRQTAAGKEGIMGDVGGHDQACSLGGNVIDIIFFHKMEISTILHIKSGK